MSPPSQEEIDAFTLVQQYVMLGEDTYSNFQKRINALKYIANRLDVARSLEERFHQSSSSGEASAEVMSDIDSLFDFP